jgi:hypothetical protein
MNPGIWLRSRGPAGVGGPRESPRYRRNSMTMSTMMTMRTTVPIPI